MLVRKQFSLKSIEVKFILGLGDLWWVANAIRVAQILPRTRMAPNNALGNPTAAKLRAAYEGEEESPSKPPAKRDLRVATQDAFGAGGGPAVSTSEV